MKVAEHAGSILVHYSGGTVYPADVGLLLLKGSLEGYAQRGCPRERLGEVVRERLDAEKREKLLALLPDEEARTIRAALAAVR